MIVLVENWWAFVLRGIIAVSFSLIAFFAPPVALLTLVFMFAFYAIADGIFAIIAAFHRRGEAVGREPWWALLVLGVFSLIAGLGTFLLPAAAAFALLYLIAGWAIATGIMSVIAAVRLRKQIEGEWLLGLSGFVSVVFGILAVLFPGAGALTVVLWIGAYAFVHGILLIALGMRLRKVVRRAEALEQCGHQGAPAVAH